MTVLLQLGEFKFTATGAGFSELSRTRGFVWAAQTRFGKAPALQFIGEEVRTVSVGGTIFTTEGAGLKQITEMESLAAKGQPLLMVAGTGDILGYWCITSISATDSALFADGVPRKQDFQLALSYYGERYPE